MLTISPQRAVFSVGACLWYCADYGLIEAEEPVLSRTLQNLLVDMTKSVVEERPTLQQIVQVSLISRSYQFNIIVTTTTTTNLSRSYQANIVITM